MPRSACLIFNPVSGQGNPEQDLNKIKELLSPEIELDIHFTTEEVDGDRLAREALERNVEAIIASGGDGTLSAVATALIGTNIPLGIISRGTANAFANALGIPDTIPEACQTILKGVVRTVDTGVCNGKPMILLVGIGFEAETVAEADRETKDRLGILAYILAGVKQLQKMEKFTAEIETEDKVIHVLATAVTIANAAPPTSILAQGVAGTIEDDGLLDVTIVAPENKLGAIAASYHLLQSALQNESAERDDIGYLRTKRVKVTTDPPQKVVVDGEIVGTTPVEIECIPKALTVFVPAHLNTQPDEKLEGLPGLQIKSKSEE
jgi:YegS/Rv2252/BmrU family lipid kinase